MRNIINEYIRMFRENRRARRKAAGLTALLALLVAARVFWNLHFIGIALTSEVYYCGLEVHQHIDECYAWVLTETTDETVGEAEEAIDEAAGAAIEDADEAAEAADKADETADETADEEITIDEAVEVTDEEAIDDAAEAADETAVSDTGEKTAETDGTVPEEETAQASEVASEEEAEKTEEWYLEHGYEKVLICKKQEHIHTIDCILDETADVETAADWEATLPETLDGTVAENLVAVAVSQLGYTESTHNFSLADDGETKKGYTRYGAWYGNSYGDWNAMFAAFCLHYAGISREDFPMESGAYAWAVQLESAGLYETADEYIPNAGDLIFLDTDEDGKANLVGIVETVTEEEEASAITYTLTAILGDYCDESASGEGETTGDAVCRVEFTSEDTAILGYGVLLYADSALVAQSLTVTADDLTVTLSGQLPVGATVTAEPIDLEVEEREVQFALEIVIYDVNGNEFEPEDGTITVTVESENITEDCVIYYVPEEGDLEEIMSESDDGTVTFEAEHFSVYAGLTAVPDETAASEEISLYEEYMAAIEEYQVQAIMLTDGDDEGAVEITSALGDLLDAAYEDCTAGDLSEDEYAEIETAINDLWDYLEENFELYGTSLATTASNGLLRASFSGGTGNTWYDLGTLGVTDPVSSSSGNLYNNKLSLTLGNVSKVTGRLTLKKNVDTGDGTLPGIILLDVRDILGSSSGLTTTQFRNKLKNGFTVSDNGSGNTSQVGTITFSNAGTVLGQTVDVIVTVNSVQFSSSYYTTWYNYVSGKKYANGNSISQPTYKNYISIAKFTNTKVNGVSQTFEIRDSYYGGDSSYVGSKTWQCRSYEFRNGGYGVPLVTTVNYTIQVVVHGTSTTVDSQFLVVASDIDIYRTTNSKATVSGTNYYNSNYGRNGSETFKTLSGFSGIYYYYKSYNKNEITSSGQGKVTVKATYDTYAYKALWNKTTTKETGSTGISGLNSYYVGAVYAETNTGTWKQSNTVLDCGTYVEVYAPASYTVQIKKVSSNSSSTKISGATFKLYKLSGTTKKYYSISSNSTVSWVTSASSATSITTGSGGTVNINYLEPGTYYLTEVTTASGYTLLDHAIQFTLSSVGRVTLASGESYASVSNGSTVVITIKNDPDVDLVLWKTDSSGNKIQYNPATFYLYYKSGSTTYYYQETSSGTNWVTNKSSATVIKMGEGGTYALSALDSGKTYYLQEITAPEGYSLLTSDVSFNIAANGTVTVNNSAYLSTTTSSGVKIVKIKDTAASSYPITLQKNDSGGTAITSDVAVFHLYKVDGQGNKTYYYINNGTVSWVDLDSGAEATDITTSATTGQVTITGLTGNTTYYLEETYAPYGYKLLEDPIKIYLSENGVLTVDSTLSSSASVDSSNKLLLKIKDPSLDKAFPVIIRKVDADGNAITSGSATFYLYRENGEGAVYYYSGTDNDGYATWVAETTAGEVPNDAEALVTDTSTGEVTASGLYPGTYYLVESEAPYGYEVLADAVQFTISGTGEVEVLEGEASVTDETGQTPLLSVKNEVNDNVYEITVYKRRSTLYQGQASYINSVQFRLYREDDDGEPLYYSGVDADGYAEWSFSSSDATVFVTSGKGTFTVQGLFAETVYFLEELLTEYGYQLLEEPAEFMISDEKVVILNSVGGNVKVSSDNLTLEVLNWRSTMFDLTVTKCDKDTGETILSNVAFALYRLDSDGNKWYQTGDKDGNQYLEGTYGVEDECIKSTTSGTVWWENMVPGVYYLEEVVTPTGYIGLDGPVEITIDSEGKITVGECDGLVVGTDLKMNSSGVNIVHLDVYNSIPYRLVISKVDEDTYDPIEGAGFYLYRYADDGETVLYYSYDEDTGTTSWIEPEEAEEIDEEGNSTTVTVWPGATLVTSDNDGLAVFENLTLGTYYLTESVTPFGYVALESDIEITLVNKDGEIVATFDDASSEYAIFDEEDSGEIAIIVENTPFYELPVAGGIGTMPYTGAGLLLTGSAAWLMYRKKRRRKERVTGG